MLSSSALASPISEYFENTRCAPMYESATMEPLSRSAPDSSPAAIMRWSETAEMSSVLKYQS